MADGLPTGLINRILNGGCALNPEGTESGADGSTCFASFTRLSESNAVQTSQLIAPEQGQAYCLRATQTHATPQRLGICQTIAYADCGDLRGAALNYGARVRYSGAGRTMYALLESTAAADTSPADPINDWTSSSYTSGQFFKSSFNVLSYGFRASEAGDWETTPYVPSTASGGLNNLVVVFWTEDVATQNATLDIGLVTVAEGTEVLSFEHRPLALEEAMASAPDPETFGWVKTSDSPPTVKFFLNGIEGFVFYEANGALRFGSPNGINTTFPAFELVGDEGVPNLYCRQLQTGFPGDTGEITFRCAGGSPEAPVAYSNEAVGQQLAFLYWINMGEWTTGVSTFSQQFLCIRPIFLTGTTAPNFAGSFRAMGISGYNNGRRYHILLPTASGTNPMLNLNGWGAHPILRNSGATPAVNYWNAGAEITLIYDSGSGGRFLADADSGSDNGGNGRTVDIRNINPFFARSVDLVARMPSQATGYNREGVAALRVTRKNEAVVREPVWISSEGCLVAGGYSSYADGKDSNNYWFDDAYQGPLTFTAGELDLPGSAPNRQRWITNNEPGPCNSIETPGIGNLFIPSSDTSRQTALAIRKNTAPDMGLNVDHVHANNRMRFNRVKRGTSPLNITDIREDAGNVQYEIVAHGFRILETIYVNGTDQNAFDGVWTARVVDADWIELIGSRHNNGAWVVQGTVAKASEFTLQEFDFQSDLVSLGGSQDNESMRVGTGVAGGTFLLVQGASASNQPLLAARGTGANIGLIIDTKGTGSLTLEAGGVTVLNLENTTLGVNSVRMKPGVTTAPPTLGSQGSDTNVGLILSTQGTGTMFLSPGGVPCMRAVYAANAVNYVEVTGGATGVYASVRAQSATDTNVDLRLTGQGNGVLRFGAFAVAAGETFAGTVTIRTDDGTLRKVAIFA